MATPRAKKSAQLLQRLNRSLEGDATAPTAAPKIVEPAEKQAASEPAKDLEIVSSPPAGSPPEKRAELPVATSALTARETNPVADRRAEAEKIVWQYVPFAVGAGLIPLPGVDLAAIGGLQLKLLGALARHYGVAFTRTQAEAIVTSLLGSVGGTVVASSALGSMAKFFPGVGTLLSLATLPIASTVVTQAFGRLAIDHFEAGGTIETFDLDLAQQAFERKIAEARQALA